MDEVLNFLRDNAAWLFGGGGLASVLLALKKRGKGAESKPAAPAQTKPSQTVSGGRVGGDIVGGNKVTKTGFGAVEVGLGAALLVAVAGLVFLFMGPSVTTIEASGGSVATQGSDNTTTVITGDSNKTTVTTEE